MRALIALAAVLIIAGCSQDHGGTAPATPPVATSTPPDAAAQAIQKCRAEVLKSLKAPATAKFSGEHTIPDDAGGFEVTGNVDSQNSFGALLRSTWLCNSSPARGTHAFVS